MHPICGLQPVIKSHLHALDRHKQAHALRATVRGKYAAQYESARLKCMQAVCLDQVYKSIKSSSLMTESLESYH